MLIETLRDSLEKFFDRIEQNFRSWLPFRGHYLRLIRARAVGDLDSIKAQVEEYFAEGGRHEEFVRFLMNHLRGRVGFMAGLLIGPLERWLLSPEARELFRNKIGSAGPGM